MEKQKEDAVIIHIRRGLRVVSSKISGNAKTSKGGTDKRVVPRFFMSAHAYKRNNKKVTYMYYTYHTISLGWVMLGVFITLLFIAVLLGTLVVLSNKKLTVISILIAIVLSAFLLFENIRMCNAFSSLKDLNNVLNDIALNNTQLSNSESSEELCSFVENVINGEVKNPRELCLYREEVIDYIWIRIIWAIVAYLIGAIVIFITMENYSKRASSSRARRVPSHDDF